MTEESSWDKTLLEDNKKLVVSFGAQPLSTIKTLPDFYTFERGLIYSHRDFDKYLAALEKGERCAIVSGFNASGTIHVGHKAVFDTNLFFQRRYGVEVFIPISDDESYVTGKAKTQEEALKNSVRLAREILAYGFDPQKTHFIIDQVYTNIYNVAIKVSRRVTLSEIFAAYGYKNEDNPGLFFYPAVQSAHILFPQEQFGIKNVLVIIGPDEDSHIRICRDIARRAGYQLPSILHGVFLPGIDGNKMSKSRDNGIFLNEESASVIKKAKKAFSGGAVTAEEQRKSGGDPDKDIAYFYLTKLFPDDVAGRDLAGEYRSGKLLSGEMKLLLADSLVKFTSGFQARLREIDDDTVERCIMKNDVVPALELARKIE